MFLTSILQKFALGCHGQSVMAGPLNTSSTRTTNSTGSTRSTTSTSSTSSTSTTRTTSTTGLGHAEMC
jgi:hypothetical protein